MYMGVKSFPVEDKYLPILHTQYHGCWCPGDSMNKGINSHGFGLDFPEYSGNSTNQKIRIFLWLRNLAGAPMARLSK